MKYSQAYRVLLFTLLPLFSLGQVNHKSAYQQVLKQAQIGKECVFDKSKREDYDRLELVYLGKINTRKGTVLKVVTSRWYWGHAPRATSRIVVFNEKSQYLGDYYLTMTYEVPQRIEGNSLVFKIDRENSNHPNLITKVSFANGIPKQFFIQTEQDGGGNIYAFAQNL